MIQPIRPPRPYYRHKKANGNTDFPGLSRDIPSIESLTDSYGLGPGYQTYPDRSRFYIAMAVRYLGLNPMVSPRPFATIAELVVFGMLLYAGFHHYVGPEPTDGTFIFQSYELGGRQPGGAVLDFVVFHNGQVGIRVQSVFHSDQSPFGNGAGDLREREQELRLLGQGFVRIVDVNQPVRGYPLENGPNEAVDQELDRILGRYAA